MKRICLLLFMPLLMFSCRKEKARWDADYVIPLINDTLTFEDYVNDSTLYVNGLGNLDVGLQRELLRFDLNSEVNIPDTTIYSAFTSSVALNLPAGFTFVNNAQEKNFSLSNLELITAYFKKGQIKVVVANTYPTNVICNVTLPNTTKDGVVLVDQLIVAPGTIANPTIGSKTIDLAYSSMDLTGVDHNSFNKLSYQITIVTDPDGPSVASTASNVTNVETKIQNLEIFYAKGYFGNRLIQDTAEIDVEILRSWIDGNIDLQDIDLELKLSNSIKAMGRIKIVELTTEKFDGTTTSLSSSQINVPQNVNPAVGAWSTLTASETFFNFNTTNSNIESFLENVGPRIKAVYEFELNPLGNITNSTNEIFPQSEAKLELKLNMPLNIGLDNFTLKDTIDFNFDKYQNNLSKAKEAEIQIDVENGFPIQGNLMLNVLDENNNVVFSTPNTGLVQSGEFGTSNAIGVNTTENFISWKLNLTDIDLLNSGKKIVITGVFDSPNVYTNTNTSVTFSEHCFLSSKARLYLTYENAL